MKKATPILPLFKQFIRDTETGKRLKKNGERVTIGTVGNYRHVLNNLIRFSESASFELRICDAKKLDRREWLSEKNYWKKFYRKFTEFMYKKGCHDNYVGTNIKVIRVFFNYLKNDKDLFTGDFQRLFYVRREEVEIFVLTTEQLKFLIHDKEFDISLTPGLKQAKDAFVFGCSTGLRFSDLFSLTNKNFDLVENQWYLKIKSLKTKTFSYIKLSPYAISIFERYQPEEKGTPVFGTITLINFNKNLKMLGELANFTDLIDFSREKQGKSDLTFKNNDGSEIRFCDKMSSHMMRRTAITTLLLLGMPEHLVRKISGHSHTSSSFNRYVHYAQSYIDVEIEKIHGQLENY